jgi:hypothetical protein
MLIYRRDVQPSESDPAPQRHSTEFDCTPKNMALPPPRGSRNLVPSRARVRGAESRLTVAVWRVGPLRPPSSRSSNDPASARGSPCSRTLFDRATPLVVETESSPRKGPRTPPPTPYPRYSSAACLLWRHARQPATRQVQIESKRSRDASAQPARGYRRRRPRAAGERLPSRAARHTQRRRRSPPPQRCRRT